jgi:hypothetical protein
MAADSEEVSGAPFTAEEQATIAARIEEIKTEVRARDGVTVELYTAIEERLDGLKEASEHVRKKDWLTMLYGAAFGMIVNDGVPPHIVQAVITTVVTGLGHIFGLGGPPALVAQT